MENNFEKEKIFHGAIVVFYKNMDGKNYYLVAENSKTGNISFVSGAKENMDQSLEESAQREVEEELGLDASKYKLTEIDVKHDFVFGPKKKERAGYRGSYQIFVSDLSDADFEVSHTKELKGLKWMTEEEVLDTLTFVDVKEVFVRALDRIKG
ncbi:NUDIX domain-containing protein [Patescibacteria group bacterium]